MTLSPRQIYRLTTAQVAPAICLFFYGNSALANCTVTSGGGTVANPNDNGVITCTTTGGDHTGKIGSYENNLTINLDANAIVNRNGADDEISNVKSATVTLQSGAAAINLAPGPYYTEDSQGFRARSSTNGDNVNQTISLEDNAYIAATQLAVYTRGFNTTNPVTTTINMNGSNSSISSNLPQLTADFYGAFFGEFIGGETFILNTNSSGDAVLDINMSGVDSSIQAYQSRIRNSGGENAQTDITLSGDGSSIAIARGITTGVYTSGVGNPLAGVTSTVTLSGDDTSISSTYSAAIALTSSLQGYQGISTVNLTGENASINVQNAASAIEVRGGGENSDVSAVITLESNTEIINEAGDFGIRVYGGERGFGPYPSSPGDHSPTTITSAGTISAAKNSFILHTGDDVITLQTGSNLSSSLGADAGEGDDTLNLEGSGSEDEIFLNFETLNANGVDWTLSGDSSIPTVNVNTGILNVDGNITGDVTIAETGTLSGDGTITGNVSNTGALALDEVNENLNIDGDFTQNSDDELTIYFDGVTGAVLDVTGTANLDGTLNLIEVDHGLSNGATITVLNAGTISGSFSTVNLTPAPGSSLVSASAAQVGNSIEITFTGGGPPSSCIVASGSGTVAAPASGDVIKCTAPTSPHTSAIGSGTTGIDATVNIQQTASLTVSADAINIDLATVNIADGASVGATAAGRGIVADSSADAVVNLTMGLGSSLSSANSSAVFVNSSAPGLSASTIDTSGTISGGTYSIQLNNGDDSVILNTGAALNSSNGADAGSGTDTLTLRGTGTEAEAFINFENLQMEGEDWTLSADNNFNEINIDSGLLKFNGNATGDVAINESGSFGGNGAITGNIANSGTLIPGDPTGVLDVTGSVANTADSTTMINMDASSVARLDSTGTFVRDGTLVFVETAPGITNNSTFTFLDTGGLGGTFNEVQIIPAPGSQIGYKVPTVNTVGDTMTVTFLESPCRVTTGTGTLLAMDSGDVVTCSTVNAPHTYKIGDFTRYLDATVNLEANATISYTGNPSVSKYSSNSSAAVELLDATINLDSGSSITATDASVAVSTATGGEESLIYSIYYSKYGIGSELVTLPTSQNITMQDNTSIRVTDSGGEMLSSAVAVSNLAFEESTDMAIDLQGDNALIEVDTGGGSTGIGTGVFCQLSDDCDALENNAVITLSGDASSINVTNDGRTTAIDFPTYVMEYSYAGTGPEATATITLSGDGANIRSNGLWGATGVNSYGETLFKPGSVDVTVNLSGANSYMDVATTGGEAYSNASGVSTYANGYMLFDASTAVTLSGADSSISVYGGEDVVGISSTAYSKYDPNNLASTTVTLTGTNAEISATRADPGVAVAVAALSTNVRSIGGEFGGEYYGRAQATVTLDASTRITASDIGVLVYASSPTQSPPSVIDSAGYIAGGTNSFLLADGDDNITLRTGSVLNSATGADAGAGSDTITLLGTATEDENFLNFETLNMNGTDWDLSGNSTLGNINVNNGLLTINGTVVGTVNVASGATFGGAGTVTGNVVNNGQVAPGNSIGTLTIDGDFTQGSDDSLTIEFDNGSIDLMNISGTATLDGTVNFVELTAGTSSGTRYTFIDAASVVGNFSTINFTPASGSTLTHAYVKVVGDDVEVVFMDCMECTQESSFEYNYTDQEYRFCDGTYWQRVAADAALVDTCATEAQLEYDTTLNTFKFCNGTNWVPFYSNAVLAACSAPGQIDYDFTNHTLRWCNASNFIDPINICSDQ